MTRLNLQFFHSTRYNHERVNNIAARSVDIYYLQGETSIRFASVFRRSVVTNTYPRISLVENIDFLFLRQRINLRTRRNPHRYERHRREHSINSLCRIPRTNEFRRVPRELSHRHRSHLRVYRRRLTSCKNKISGTRTEPRANYGDVSRHLCETTGDVESRRPL